MVRHNFEYPKGAQNTVKRYSHQAAYSLQKIHTLINTTPFLHVSFNTPDSPFPITLPLIGQMGSFSRPSAGLGDTLDCYLHGYVSSRIMNLSRSSPSTGHAQDSGDKAGLPVTISATKLTGLVLTLTHNSHNYNYQSCVLFGYALPVTDPLEKIWAMELITNSVVPDRWRNTRVPPNKGEMESTSILRVRVVSGSAKVREGGPEDGVGDKEDEALKDKVWTGVLPVYEQIGAPVPGPYNKLPNIPEHITSYRNDFNEQSLEYAGAAARMDPPVKKKVVGEEE